MTWQIWMVFTPPRPDGVSEVPVGPRRLFKWLAKSTVRQLNRDPKLRPGTMSGHMWRYEVRRG